MSTDPFRLEKALADTRLRQAQDRLREFLIGLYELGVDFERRFVPPRNDDVGFKLTFRGPVTRKAFHSTLTFSAMAREDLMRRSMPKAMSIDEPANLDPAVVHAPPLRPTGGTVMKVATGPQSKGVDAARFIIADATVSLEDLTVKELTALLGIVLLREREVSDRLEVSASVLQQARGVGVSIDWRGDRLRFEVHRPSTKRKP